MPKKKAPSCKILQKGAKIDPLMPLHPIRASGASIGLTQQTIYDNSILFDNPRRTLGA
jgi:hypothetical protein